MATKSTMTDNNSTASTSLAGLESTPSTRWPEQVMSEDEEPDGVFSDQLTQTSTLINLLIISTVLSLFGITTNIANIVVFAKQGLQDSVNINLFAIAISDTWSCLTLVWSAICHNPLLINSDAPFLSLEVEFLTAGGLHVIALNITAWLTAFVTFERCVSITCPLKVKTIITTTRTKAFIITTVVLTIVCKIPIYVTTKLGWKFVPSRNGTYFGMIFGDDNAVVKKITFIGTDLIPTIMSFWIIVVCTLVLVVKLWQKSKWRKAAAANDKDKTSAKDKKVMKMVVMVAAIFIACYKPNFVIASIMAAIPDYMINGKYYNNLIVSWNFSSVFESLSSSANIFVYYKMSTRYRTVFREIFCGK